MKNIFVGNLDFNVGEQSIQEAFEKYGAVERVNLVRDRDTGQPRGFAFVEMTNDGDADRAISELNGAMLGSRAINVNEARPKTFGGGGGGRPGGGGFRGRSSGSGRRREPRW